MTCLGRHTNDFEHFDPQIAALEKYDLGIKMQDEAAPPPTGSSSEPRLYLYVSVVDTEANDDYPSIDYARSRTYLRDGFPSSEADRAKMLDDVVARLEQDVEALVRGELASSEEEPVFV